MYHHGKNISKKLACHDHFSKWHFNVSALVKNICLHFFLKYVNKLNICLLFSKKYVYKPNIRAMSSWSSYHRGFRPEEGFLCIFYCVLTNKYNLKSSISDMNSIAVAADRSFIWTFLIGKLFQAICILFSKKTQNPQKNLHYIPHK